MLPGYSIITIEFPTKKETYIGYCQASVGIGLMLGPVIGQALYSLVQFEKTFYIFAGIMSVAMLIIVVVIPSHLNHADDILSRGEIDQYFERLKSTDARSSSFLVSRPVLMRSDAKTTQSSEVTYLMFLKNRRAMMALVSGIFAMIFMLFFDGILTMHLISEMDVGENSAGKKAIIELICIGYFFGLICATYALSSPFVSVLTTLFPRKWLTFFAFLLASVALLMFGPSQLLKFPE